MSRSKLLRNRYSRLVNSSKTDISERFFDYIFTNPLKILWTLALIFGFSLFLIYCHQIQYVPLLNGDQVPYLLLMIFAIGVSTLLLIAGIFIVPGLMLKAIGFSAKVEPKAAGWHFFSILLVFELVIPSPKEHQGWIWFFLFLVATGLMSWVLGLWKSDEKFVENFLRVMFFGFSSYVIPIISIIIFSLIVAQGQFSQLFGNGLLDIGFEVAVIVLILYVINVSVVTSNDWKGYALILVMASSLVVFFAPQMISKAAPSLGKFGDFHADLFLDKAGCEMLRGEGFNFEEIQKALKKPQNSGQYSCKSINTAKNVFVLWRYGKEALIKVNRTSERRFLIDNKHIMAIAISELTKASPTQAPANGDTK